MDLFFRTTAVVALVVCTSSLHANHDDDACPDIHIAFGDVVTPGVRDASLLPRPAGKPFIIGEQMKIGGYASAYGECRLFNEIVGECVEGLVFPRYPISIGVLLEEAPPGGWTGSLGTIRAWESGSNFIDAWDSQQSTSPRNYTPWKAGTYQFRLTNDIWETTCLIPPYEIEDTIEVDVVPEQRCDDPDVDSENPRNDLLQGNPCDVATGNKTETRTDYRGPGIAFTRTYNSRLPARFGIGFGWISNFHRTLELRYNKLTARRASGAGEPFSWTGTAWAPPPDSDLLLDQDATGFTLTRPNGSTERYDLDGRLLAESDPAGNTTAYTYDVDGYLTTVTGPFGHELAFTYTADGDLETLTDPAGQITRYGYDSNRNLTSVTYPDSSALTYHYEDTTHLHVLTGITDENGDRYATFAYDGASGKAISTEHAQTDNGAPQERYAFVYGYYTTMTDPAGNGWRYQFKKTNNLYRLDKVTSLVDGKIYDPTIDTQNNVTSVIDENGRRTNYAFNATNQRTSMTEAYGTPYARTTTYEYVSPDIDLVTRETTESVYAGNDREVVTTYDGNLNVTSVTINGFAPDGTPVSRPTSFQHNGAGQVTQIDGPAPTSPPSSITTARPGLNVVSAST